MGILDAPGLSRSANRISGLLNRFAPADTLMVPAITTDLPTVTMDAASSVTGRTSSVMSTTELNLLGTRGTWETNYGRMRVGDNVTPGIETVLYGDTMELCFDTNSGSTQPLWIWVDGKPTTATPFNGGAVTAGSRWYLKLVFGSVANRRIEIFGQSILAFVKINTPFSALLTAPPRKPVVGFVFDSFGAGATTETYLSAPFLISRQLGVECVNASIGGTGYVNAGSFNIFGSSTRVGNISVATPELIIMSGSVNDDAQSGVQAAATAAYAAYLAACPQAKIIVFGTQPTNATNTLGANRNARNAELKAAALAAPNVLTFHDMIGTAAGLPAAWTSGGTRTDGDINTYNGSVWRWRGPQDGNSVPGTSSRWEQMTYAFTGTGQIGSTTGNGSRDFFLASDGVHPAAPGSAAFAIRQAAAIREDLRAIATA
jgi:hypothetical protein